MAARSLICPSCGGHIEVTQDLMQYFCPYCGANVTADDGIQRVLIRDEAKLKELELQEEERIRQEQEEQRQAEILAVAKKRWRVALVLYLGAWLLYSLAVYLFPKLVDLLSGVNTAIATIWLFLGPLFIQFAYPFTDANGHYVRLGKNENISKKRVFLMAVILFFVQVLIISAISGIFSNS